MTTDADGQRDDDTSADEARAERQDAAPDAELSATGTEPRYAGVRSRRLPPAGVVFAAFAFFAAAAAGFLWWQYREFYVALDRADGETQNALREVRVELRGLEDRLATVAEARADLSAELEQVVNRVNSYPARFTDLEERLAAALGVSSQARARWLRAQAEYFLNVANTELTLRSNRANSIEALELADQALLDAGNPAFGTVRERIAGELLALRAVAVPDIEGLSFSLSQLAARIPELPMRTPIPDRDAAAAASNETAPGIGRLWQSIKNALGSMFRIERRDTSNVYSLTRDQQILVRRQLELELTLARSGLVEAMPEVFSASLASARSLLETHFDVEQTAVDGALALLDEMAALEIAPGYPDISGSLALLRNLADRDG